MGRPNIRLAAALALALAPAFLTEGAGAQLPEIFEIQEDSPLVVLPAPRGSRNPIVIPGGPGDAPAAPTAAPTPAPKPPEKPRWKPPPLEKGLRLVALVNDKVVLSLDGAQRILARGQTVTWQGKTYRIAGSGKTVLLVPKGGGKTIELRISSPKAP